MEYEFRKDFITGVPIAKFSYEHEVFGPWLETEVASAEQIERIMQLIDEADSSSASMESTLLGKEYTLSISSGEVEITANANHQQGGLPDEVIDDVDDFEQNSHGSCGIDDFVQMLQSWQEFNQN